MFRYFQIPDDEFPSSGHRPVAKRIYEMAGITAKDVDVALLYDHFSPMVIMQLEDYGFAPSGEPLLELDAENVLVTHGQPVMGGGTQALRNALNSKPWYHHG